MEVTKVIAIIVVFLMVLTTILIGIGMVGGGISTFATGGWITLLLGACVIYGAQRAFFCVYNN